MLDAYNRVIFLVNNWDRILAFVNSVFDSIAAIASGAISQASAFVEKTMAQTIPLILDFIAQQLNLSGFAERITKIIHRIRKPIDQVIDKVIDWITKKVKKIADKLLGKDKNKTKDKDKEKVEDSKKEFEKDKGDDKNNRDLKQKKEDLNAAMIEAKNLLSKYNDKEVDRSILQSTINPLKAKYKLKDIHIVPNGIHWKVVASINPESEEDLESELPNKEKLQAIAKALKIQKHEIMARLLEDGNSRNADRQEYLSDLKKMDQNQEPKLEGFIFEPILQENINAYKEIKKILGTIPIDALIGMKRGGAFLAETVAYGEEQVQKKLVILEKGTDPEPNPNKRARFNPEAFKEEIRERVKLGQKSFGIIDAYMGGRFARELRNKVIQPLLKEFGPGVIHFHIFWLRETFGFETLSGDQVKLIEEQGKISENSPYAKDVTVKTIPLTMVLGDDMKMILEDLNSSKPIHIFDEDGDIIKSYHCEEGVTSRETLIKLLKGNS